MTRRFEGKRVFLTGASAGIGAAVAVELAREGARLGLAARRANRLDEVRKRIADLGGEAIALECDIRDRSSLDAATARMAETFGGIDVAIANAGFGVAGPFDKLTTDDFRRQFETNVFGTLDTIYAVLPYLLQTKGHIALVASVLGRLATPSSAPYCSSKFALCGLAESLQYDLASKGVTVTCIEPGIVSSEIRSVDNRGVFHEKHKDPAPAWLVVPTEKAAREIVHYLYKKKFEAVITGHGRFLVWANRHFTWLLRSIALHFARKKSDPMRRGKKPQVGDP